MKVDNKSVASMNKKKRLINNIQNERVDTIEDSEEFFFFF